MGDIVNVLEQSCPIVSVFESSLKNFTTQVGFKALAAQYDLALTQPASVGAMIGARHMRHDTGRVYIWTHDAPAHRLTRPINDNHYH